MYAYIHDVPEHCINVLVSDMQTIFRASQEDNIPFGQPTLFCSWTVLPLASRKQASSYGLSVQPSKAECCPTAQVRKTQWNLMRLTNLLVILHQLVCRANITKQLRLALEIHKIKIQKSRTCVLVYCTHAAGVPESSYDASDKQQVATLSMAFTSNPQDLMRYSTMNNWPSCAARCKAEYPSLESKRWFPIFEARYSATPRWLPMAHKTKVLLPLCI